MHQSVGALIASVLIRQNRRASFENLAIVLLFIVPEKRKRLIKMCELNNLDEYYKIAEELVLYAGKVSY